MRDYNYYEEECPVCAGDGYIYGQGDTHTCGECGGSGRVLTDEGVTLLAEMTRDGTVPFILRHQHAFTR